MCYWLPSPLARGGKSGAGARSPRARLDTKLQGIDTSVPVSAPGGCRGSTPSGAGGCDEARADAGSTSRTATRLLADLLGMEILLPFSHGSILHPLPI